METNYLEGGAPLVGTYEMQVLLTSAATLCSRNQTKAIVVAGYSQGAAIVHKAIAGLSEAVRERITAVVTFGDTRGLQDAYAIPGFRRNKTLIVCNPGDALCAGMLLVLWPAHWDYIRHVPAAATWLAQKILEVAPNITQVIPVPSVITPVVAQPAPDDASTPTPAASPTAASTSVASAATASAAATAAPSDTALSQVLWWWLPSAWQGQQQKQQTGTASTGSVATKAARRRRWPYFNWAA